MTATAQRAQVDMAVATTHRTGHDVIDGEVDAGAAACADGSSDLALELLPAVVITALGVGQLVHTAAPTAALDGVAGAAGHQAGLPHDTGDDGTTDGTTATISRTLLAG